MDKVKRRAPRGYRIEQWDDGFFHVRGGNGFTAGLPTRQEAIDAARKDAAPLAKKKRIATASRNFRSFLHKRAGVIADKTGLTEYQVLRGVASGAIKCEIDPGYLELCKQETKKREAAEEAKEGEK